MNKKHDTDCELSHLPIWEVALIEAGGGHACQCWRRVPIRDLRAALTHSSSGHPLSGALAAHRLDAMKRRG